MPCRCGVLEYGVAVKSPRSSSLGQPPQPTTTTSRKKGGFMLSLLERRSKEREESWSTPVTPITSSHGGQVFDPSSKPLPSDQPPCLVDLKSKSRSRQVEPSEPDEQVGQLSDDCSVTTSRPAKSVLSALRLAAEHEGSPEGDDDVRIVNGSKSKDGKRSKSTRGEDGTANGSGSGSFCRMRLHSIGGARKPSIPAAENNGASSLGSERKKSFERKKSLDQRSDGGDRQRSLSSNGCGERHRSLAPEHALSKSPLMMSQSIHSSIHHNPSLGLAGLGKQHAGGSGAEDPSRPRSEQEEKCEDFGDLLKQSFRFDLDDLNGEVVLLRWGDVKVAKAAGEGGTDAGQQSDATTAGGSVVAEAADKRATGLLARAKGNVVSATLMRYGPNLSKRLTITSHVEGKDNTKLSTPLRRLLQLDGNRFVSALPPAAPDAVGQE